MISTEIERPASAPVSVTAPGAVLNGTPSAFQEKATWVPVVQPPVTTAVRVEPTVGVPEIDTADGTAS